MVLFRQVNRVFRRQVLYLLGVWSRCRCPDDISVT